MSVSGSTNYMSNATILAWMELKTEGLYGQMRAAMDQSNDRANAEDALNKIKGKIADAAANGTDATELRADLQAAIDKYGAEFPDVKKTLQPIVDELTKRHEANVYSAHHRMTWANISVNLPSDYPVSVDPVKLTKEDSERWGKEISDQVDAFGKTDQLGMVNIQEFNAQLNQAKNTASSLMDSADKAAQNIIGHIA
jgi:F0F1-type ATP synthase membrane subunit b/b'